MSSPSGLGLVPATLVAVYTLATVLPAALAGYAFRTHRDSPTARAFAATMVAIAVWAGAYLGRLLGPGWARFPLTVVAFAGVAATPPALLVFALRYTDRERYVTPATVASLAVVPLLTVVLVATTRSHGLFYTSLEIVEVGPLATVVGDSGPWFWVHTAYSYGLLALASLLLVVAGITRRRLYRMQAVFLVLGVLVAWVANAAFLAGLTPLPTFDLTPVGLAAGSVLLAVALFRARLIDVTPIARDAVVKALDDAVVVIEDGRVVDVNGAARSLLAVDAPIAEPATVALPGALETALTAGDRLVELPRDGERRCYRIRTLPLDESGAGSDPEQASLTDTGGETDPESTPMLSPGVAGDGPPAVVLLLSDVTAQRRHLRQLRKQNERLEEFAAAAAHDLRNPLNVIDGYVELAQETGEPEHFDRIDRATDRMSRLVEDLLALGRRGRLVESTVPVSLSEATEQAWEGIDAAGATLVVEPGDPVPADSDRLVQLLENLFVNAVEHGTRHDAGGQITVTVGRTSDGFYVADDGRGIPANQRTQVFDYGFTTQEGGSGFGLAIVETIADAHGWDVTLTESADGGARFEVVGVEQADPETVAEAARG
jgi:signal transduction histidine kinase